ncbi:hypothetical protein [Paenibacillus sp. FSL H3-0333]|uniref:hypothetical protein n=1 Tax=Paenibacillus sp. FSL H3-0333 TaxID=2921373 RepID=UPI0030F91933
MTDIVYAIQQQQLQKTYGELNALLALHYDPMKGSTVRFEELNELIKNFINGLGDLIG